MKSLKRILAFLAATIALIWLSGIRCFAVGVAPVVAGEEIAEVLITLLLGAGHSQSELDNMSVTELQALADSDLKSGKISHNTVISDPLTGVQMSVIDYFQSDTFKQDKAMFDLVTAPIKDFITDLVDGPEVLLTPTPIVDMQGHGSLLDYYGTPLYGEYIVLRPYDNPAEHNGNWGSFTIYYEGGGSFTTSYDENIKFYGDVRYLDGTQAPTADKYEYVVGEADGTKVTLDMLNPDGSVTIDGVTYYPADYFDPDKLTDTGKDKLIYDITNIFNNTYVKSDDKPFVDEDDITVEVAEELENFTVSPSIITVFPFCLPFDFVRGMKLFSAQPKTPHFEVTVDVPSILNIPAQQWTLVIDLGDFEELAKITRWTSIIGFVYLLISLSTKIVKGAGA